MSAGESEGPAQSQGHDRPFVLSVKRRCLAMELQEQVHGTYVRPFEALQPFLDCNRRIARFLVMSALADCGGLSSLLLYLSARIRETARPAVIRLCSREPKRTLRTRARRFPARPSTAGARRTQLHEATQPSIDSWRHAHVALGNRAEFDCRRPLLVCIRDRQDARYRLYHRL